MNNNVNLGTTMSLGKNILYGTYLYPVTRPINDDTLCVFIVRNDGNIDNFPYVQTDAGNTIAYCNKKFSYGDTVLIPYKDLSNYQNTCGNPTCNKRVVSITNETCSICGWLKCSCGYCGCNRGYSNNKKLHIINVPNNTYYSHLQPFNITHCNLSLELDYAIKDNFRNGLEVYPKVIEILYKGGYDTHIFINQYNGNSLQIVKPQIVIERNSINAIIDKIYDIFYTY